MKILNFLEKIGSFIKSLFLNGLFTILPITATIFFITFTYRTLASWLQPLKRLEPLYLQKIPGMEILIVTIFIFLIGAMLKMIIIAPIIHYFERIIKKIPLIRTVYSSAKTLVNFFDVPDPKTLSKKVVLIQFPKENFYNIAFQLESAEDSFQKLLPEEKKLSGKKYYKVFMPNSPNPATGYFLILPEDEIIPTNMTFEEAIKTVVSCGLITPESIKKLQS